MHHFRGFFFWVGWPNFCIYAIKSAEASDLRTRYYLVSTTNTNCHSEPRQCLPKQLQ